MAGLSDLVKGYEQGQQLQQSKARDLADKEARKFEQQYKLSQAQQQAQVQQQQYDLEKQRVALEQAAQVRLAARDKADAAHKEQQDFIAAQRGKALQRHYEMGDAMKDPAAVRKEIAKAAGEYRKAGFGSDAAMQNAIQDAADAQGAIKPFEAQGQNGINQSALLALHGAGSQIMGGGGAAPLAQQNAPGMVGAPPMAQIRPPGEVPAGRDQPSPASIIAQQKAAAELEAKTTHAAKEREQTKQLQQLAKVDEDTKRAKLLMTNAQRKALEQATAFKKESHPFEIAAEIVKIHEGEANTKKILASIDIDKRREDRLSIEAVIKNSKADDKQKHQILTELKSVRADRDKLGNEVMSTVKAMANLDFGLNDPAVSKSDKETIKKLKIGHGERLGELMGIQQHVIQEYEAMSKMAAQQHLIEPTSASGGPAPSRAAANRAAIIRDANRAANLPARVQPPPGLPSGMQRAAERSRDGRPAGVRPPSGAKKKSTAAELLRRHGL